MFRRAPREAALGPEPYSGEMTERLPAIYLPHGGGPWPFVELRFGPPGMWLGMRNYLVARARRSGPRPSRPTAARQSRHPERRRRQARLRSRYVRAAQGPAARACHPRQEHLLPLHVIAGASHTDKATMPYRERVMGVDVSAVRFG